VPVEIKFCGMTRAADAREGVALGAAFVGVIFAGGPRKLTTSLAAEVLGCARGARRVGVFGNAPLEEIASVATTLDLDVVQLHDLSDVHAIRVLRDSFGGQLWVALRLADGVLPVHARDVFAAADAVVLDAEVPGKLGGTGVALPWQGLAIPLAELRRADGARLVLAGGLRADNVGEAIRVLRPDVVDVSSGVESAPGVKDHARMRAFRDAVRESTK
jgi:phosphoribosylanthranilate isomerase